MWRSPGYSQNRGSGELPKGWIWGTMGMVSYRVYHSIAYPYVWGIPVDTSIQGGSMVLPSFRSGVVGSISTPCIW